MISLPALATLLSVTLLSSNAADVPKTDVASIARRAVDLQGKLFDDIERHCFTMRIFQEEPGEGPHRKRETRLEHVCFRNGVPVYNRLEINGKPTGIKMSDPFPPPDDEWRKRAERIREARKTQIDIIKQCLKAFEVKLAGEGALEGRPVWILDLTPDPNYRAVSRTTELLKNAVGRVWIDKETNYLMMVRAHTTKDFTIWGGLIARVRNGATFELRQKPFGKVWLPYFLEENWEGRVGLVKHIGDHVRLERYDFREGTADQRPGAR